MKKLLDSVSTSSFSGALGVTSGFTTTVLGFSQRKNQAETPCLSKILSGQTNDSRDTKERSRHPELHKGVAAECWPVGSEGPERVVQEGPFAVAEKWLVPGNTVPTCCFSNAFDSSVGIPTVRANSTCPSCQSAGEVERARA